MMYDVVRVRPESITAVGGRRAALFVADARTILYAGDGEQETDDVVSADITVPRADGRAT